MCLVKATGTSSAVGVSSMLARLHSPLSTSLIPSPPTHWLKQPPTRQPSFFSLPKNKHAERRATPKLVSLFPKEQGDPTPRDKPSLQTIEEPNKDRRNRTPRPQSKVPTKLPR